MQSAWIRALPFLALLSLLSAGEAAAADCRVVTPTGEALSPCVDVDNLWPHPGGGPYFALGSTATTPRGSIAFGIVGSFFTQPLGVRVSSPDPAGSDVFIVDQVFDATLLLALGVADRLELTLAAPSTLYQNGAGLAAVVGSYPPQLRSAVRDLRFGFAMAIVRRPGNASGPALTGRFEVAAPTGSDGAFAKGPTAVLAPSLAFSWRIGRVDVSAEALARVRGEVMFAGAVVGPQVGGAVGASVDVLPDRWLGLGAELFALVTTSAQQHDPTDLAAATPPLVPAEWIAHVSTAHFLGGDLTLSLGGGSSVPFTPRSAITSPRYRLDFAIRYAPIGTKAPQGATSPR
jgi:hypothetical protein